MKPARQFANEIDQARFVDILGMVETDRREVRAAALREAVKALRSADFLADGYRAVVEMADAAHESVCPFDATKVADRAERGVGWESPPVQPSPQPEPSPEWAEFEGGEVLSPIPDAPVRGPKCTCWEGLEFGIHACTCGPPKPPVPSRADAEADETEVRRLTNDAAKKHAIRSVPSCAELIELMCAKLGCPVSSQLGRDLADGLDALIKAGAVRNGL